MIQKTTYTKLTKSRSYLRNKLQSIFIMSTAFLGFLIASVIVNIIYGKFKIVDIIPILVYLPLYSSMLVRKVKIIIYRYNNDIKM